MLRRLGHTDEDNVIQLKGQTASQISTADELVVTELMFNGIFGVREKCEQCCPLLIWWTRFVVARARHFDATRVVPSIAQDLSAPQIVALLSALMSTEKTQTEGDPAARLPEELRHPFNQLKIAAKRVADISQVRCVCTAACRCFAIATTTVGARNLTLPCCCPLPAARCPLLVPPGVTAGH